MPEIRSNTIQAHIAWYDEEKDNYEFLVLQRSADQKLYPSLWQVVTGWIEGEETAVQAAVREIKEETGLQISGFWTIPFITSFYNSLQDAIQFSTVFGAMVRDKAETKISDEHMDFKWLGFSDYIDMLELPTHKDAARHFLNYIIKNKNNAIFEVKDWD